jgi:hypothetical protein
MHFSLKKGRKSEISLMMEAVRTSETSVDNHFTRQYIPEDNSEQGRKYLNVAHKGTGRF